MANSRVDPNTMLAEVCFNGGKPNKLFRVQVDVMFKDPNDQLDEINQQLNPEDTKRVEYIWYECPLFDEGRITFSRSELTNDEDVRSMFSIFGQLSMFPTIKMDALLLRLPEDILKSLI